MRRVIDQFLDLREVYHKNAHDDKFHIEIVQDVSGYIKANQDQFNVTEKGTTWKGDFHKVASIPVAVLNEWAKELGDWPLKKEYEGWLTAKLNSNEFYKLRTRAGYI